MRKLYRIAAVLSRTGGDCHSVNPRKSGLKLKNKKILKRLLTFSKPCAIISKHECENRIERTAKMQNGELAQLARASGSYPAGRWFKSDIRYHQNAMGVTRFRCVLLYGALVKRLRHGPFTAVTGVRFP